MRYVPVPGERSGFVTLKPKLDDERMNFGLTRVHSLGTVASKSKTNIGYDERAYSAVYQSLVFETSSGRLSVRPILIFLRLLLSGVRSFFFRAGQAFGHLDLALNASLHCTKHSGESASDGRFHLDKWEPMFRLNQGCLDLIARIDPI